MGLRTSDIRKASRRTLWTLRIALWATIAAVWLVFDLGHGAAYGAGIVVGMIYAGAVVGLIESRGGYLR